MIQFDPDRNPVEVLAEEFLARQRRGETPTVEEYRRQYPQLAQEISAVFPSLELMEAFGAERARQSDSDSLIAPVRKIDRLGDFRIVGELGRGGMGVVYEAEQSSLGRRVAVKVLAESTFYSPKQLDRFRREAHSAAALHHSNIVPIFGVGEQDGLHYYVMQLIDGVPLDRVIAQLRRRADNGAPAAERDEADTSDTREETDAAWAAAALLQGTFLTPGRIGGNNRFTSNSTKKPAPEDSTPATLATESSQRSGSGNGFSATALATPPAAELPVFRQAQAGLGPRYWRSIAQVVVQLAGGMRYAHGQGVLHRDVKPSNMLLDRDGVAWITDFGLAKPSCSEDLTATGDIIGTLRYMAPEQLRGETDQRSDLFSLGLTLYELATLRPARQDHQPAKLLKQLDSHAFARPRSVNPAIPRDLETIILKAIAPDAHQRYASMEAFEEDLQRFLHDQPIRARRASTVEHAWRWARRNPGMASLGATVLVLLVMVAVVASIGNIRTNRALIQSRIAANQSADLVCKAERVRDSARLATARAEANWRMAIGVFDRLARDLSNRQSVPTKLVLEELKDFYLELGDRSDAQPEEVAMAYQRIAEIEVRLHDPDAARSAYEKVYNIYRRLAQKRRDNDAYASASVDTLIRRGVLAQDQGNLLDALQWYAKARDLRHEYAAESAGPQTHGQLASSSTE